MTSDVDDLHHVRDCLAAALDYAGRVDETGDLVVAIEAASQMAARRHRHEILGETAEAVFRRAIAQWWLEVDKERLKYGLEKLHFEDFRFLWEHREPLLLEVYKRFDIPAQIPRYFVKTWDTELQKYTPQIGVPHGPYTLFGLRAALRGCLDCGFDRPSIYVEKIGWLPDDNEEGEHRRDEEGDDS